MKAKLEQLSLKSDDSSFLCYEVKVPRFEFLWHNHPEFELTYIVHGQGRRLVGDSYEVFEEGDLALLGPYIPHTWTGHTNDGRPCKAIVIQFREELFTPLLAYPELNCLSSLLTKANRGLLFNSKEMPGLTSKLINMPGYSGADAFISLLQILKELSLARRAYLSSGRFKPVKGNENQQRINKVFVYIQEQFADEISLKKAASMFHLSESAFCKFFKRVSGKTFSGYVNDVRVAKACELLIETDKSVEAIAFETGFATQTYFNRVFLRKKGLQPSRFRSHYDNL